MSITLTEPWQVALFVLLCLAAIYVIVRNMWREWTTPNVSPEGDDDGEASR
jgi:hypothetical protein